MPSLIRKIAVLVAVLLLTSNALANPPLRATLSETNGSWKLHSLNQSSGNVSLSSLSGHYVGNTSRKDCWRGFLGLTKGDCKDIEFTSSRPAGDNLLAPIFAWPVGLVYNIFATPFGNFDDALILPIIVSRKFDKGAYNEAFKEALSRTEGDASLESVLDEYARLQEAAKSIDAEYSEVGKRLNGFSSKMKQVALDAFQLQVVDLSGFWPGSDLNVGPGDFNLVVDATELKQLAELTTRSSTAVSNLNQELFPAKDLGDFSQRLNRAEVVLEKDKSLQQEQIGRLNSALAQGNATIVPSDTGRITSQLKKKGLIAELDLPRQVRVRNGKPEGTKGTVTITGKNFYNVLPSSYSFSNSDIALSLEGDTLKISNLAGTYISLDALTLYHQDDVLTLGGESLREIAPGSYFTMPLKRFTLTKLATTYTDMTHDSARTMSVEFGFACKYRRTDLSQARSFVEIKTYPLLDLLNPPTKVAGL